MSLHISKRDAEAEAICVAEAFVAAEVPEDGPRSWRCGPAMPDVRASGYKLRRTVIKWSVGVRWIPEDGVVLDGDGVVLVNIETGEARWS